MRRARLKAKRPEPDPEQALAAAVFYEAVTRTRRCAMCGRNARRLHAHHVIEKQVVKALVGKDWAIVYDPRNGIALDPTCHERHTNRSHPLPRRKVPLAAWQFAEELGLESRIERSYPKEES